MLQAGGGERLVARRAAADRGDSDFAKIRRRCAGPRDAQSNRIFLSPRSRVVAPTDLETDDNKRSAAEFGIDVVRLEDSPARQVWREHLARTHRDDAAINAARERRKALKRAKTYGKRRKEAGGD